MAISFAVRVGWKNIVLAGIDLDNNRYFYLKKNKTAIWNEQRNIKFNDPHYMKNRTIDYLNNFVKWSKLRGITVYTVNKKSTLGKILPVL